MSVSNPTTTDGGQPDEHLETDDRVTTIREALDTAREVAPQERDARIKIALELTEPMIEWMELEAEQHGFDDVADWACTSSGSG